MTTTQTKDPLQEIAHMDRAALTVLLKGLDCPFALDFTEEYLGSLSIERLRHVVVAALAHARPSCPAAS